MCFLILSLLRRLPLSVFNSGYVLFLVSSSRRVGIPGFRRHQPSVRVGAVGREVACFRGIARVTGMISLFSAFSSYRRILRCWKRGLVLYCSLNGLEP